MADVTEAMSRERPHRASLGLQATVDLLGAGRGILFDAEVVVDVALALVEDGSLTL